MSDPRTSEGRVLGAVPTSPLGLKGKESILVLVTFLGVLVLMFKVLNSLLEVKIYNTLTS